MGGQGKDGTPRRSHLPGSGSLLREGFKADPAREREEDVRMPEYQAPTLSEIGSVEELTLETTVAAVDNDDGGNS